MTDVDVAMLQAKVAKLERTVTFLLEKLNIAYVDDPGSTVSAAVRSLLEQGNKIGAIQQYREKLEQIASSQAAYRLTFQMMIHYTKNV